MINQKDHPLAWCMLMDDLEDAHEHLGNLIKDITAGPDYGEPELRIDLGHVYAHLNRAWRRRTMTEDFDDGEWETAGAFPEDLDPIA